MTRLRIALHVLLLCAGPALPGCDSLDDGDDDRDVEPEADVFHDLSEQCGFDGPELEPRLHDSVPAFARCTAGDCVLRGSFMTALRVPIHVDLSGHTVAVAATLISQPDGGGDQPAAVTRGSPVLLRDRCTREPRALVEVALVRAGEAVLELEAGTTDVDRSTVGAWALPVADPETIAIVRDGGDELADELELGAGDSVALESAVHSAAGEVLTTLGSERWWSDDEDVLAVRDETQADGGQDAGLPPALQARGSRVVVEALAPGETELHVLAANVERVVTVTVTP